MNFLIKNKKFILLKTISEKMSKTQTSHHLSPSYSSLRAQTFQLNPNYSQFLLSKLQAMANIELNDIEKSECISSITEDSLILYSSNITNSEDYVDIQHLIESIQ